MDDSEIASVPNYLVYFGNHIYSIKENYKIEIYHKNIKIFEKFEYCDADKKLTILGLKEYFTEV